MLTIAIDDQHELTGGTADAALHGGAVAFVVGMTDHSGAGVLRAACRVVRRPIIDHDDLAPRSGTPDRRHHGRNREGFIVSGNDDGDC
jgi:hypothetical protein